MDIDMARQNRMKALEDLLANDPTDVFALYGLALEHKALSDLDKARNLLEKTVKNDPEHVYAYYQLGEVLIAQGNDEDAVEILEKGISQAGQLGHMKAMNELQALLDLI